MLLLHSRSRVSVSNKRGFGRFAMIVTNISNIKSCTFILYFVRKRPVGNHTCVILLVPLTHSCRLPSLYIPFTLERYVNLLFWHKLWANHCLALSKPSSFAVYWLVSFVSLAAFICLAKFLAGANECEGALCTVTKIVTAVVFFSYAVWVTATTLIGIEISKDNGRAGEVSQEKLTALSDD